MRDRVWRFLNPDLHYQNRLRLPDYQRLFAEAGLTAVAENVKQPTDAERRQLDAIDLAPRFRALPGRRPGRARAPAALRAMSRARSSITASAACRRRRACCSPRGPARPTAAGAALCYHRVGNPQGRQGYELVPALGSRLFAEQLRLVRDRFTLVTASELPEAVATRRRGAPFPLAVTFDDDLAGHATVTLDLLRAGAHTGHVLRRRRGRWTARGRSSGRRSKPHSTPAWPPTIRCSRAWAPLPGRAAPIGLPTRSAGSRAASATR